MVADQSVSGHPKSFKETLTIVLLALAKSPNKVHRQFLQKSESVKEAFLPYCMETCSYKLQILRHLAEDDPYWCTSASEFWKCSKPVFALNILFCDESNQIDFVNGEVNKQNFSFWSISNPYWMIGRKMQSAGIVIIWCRICRSRIDGPFCF